MHCVHTAIYMHGCLLGLRGWLWALIQEHLQVHAAMHMRLLTWWRLCVLGCVEVCMHVSVRGCLRLLARLLACDCATVQS